MKSIRGIFLLAALILLLLPQGAAAQSITRQNDYVRLHILAESDDHWDQAVKLCVRDAVRAFTARLLADCESADEAWALIALRQDELLNVARECARGCGFAGDLTLELGVFPFPERVYGSEVVPEGEYRAVRILLGAGKGHNWWCVLYPSLCLPESDSPLPEIHFYSELGQWFLRLWKAVAA